ncbi:hypothetical protein ABPG72_020550 [Tetrahymena utriculariae]
MKHLLSFKRKQIHSLNYGVRMYTSNTYGEANLLSAWQEKRHYLPDFMRVTGMASGYLAPEKVFIKFQVETLRDSAGASLAENNQKLSNAIQEMKKIGVEEIELTTQDMSISPSLKRKYNPETKTEEQIFEGYKAENNLVFISKKLDLAGQVIDIAVRNGVNRLSRLEYVPTQPKIQELKDSLIAEAIEDAVNRAKLSLQPLNHEIKSIKRLDVNNTKPRIIFDDLYSHLQIVEKDDLDDKNQLQGNLKKFSVYVTVSFVIGEKKSYQN